MESKILILLFFGIILSSSVSAELDFNIKQSCEVDEEPLFSMYSKTGGNIGEPDHFKWQVCGQDVEDAKIKDSCGKTGDSLISMFQRNDSHASINEEYRWDVCSPNLKTNLTQSCDTPIASMHSDTDSHVAEPGHYKWQLCPFTAKPENVSIEMEFDAGDVYVDDTSAEERSYNPIELSYPYIVSDQPVGMVSYGDVLRLDYETEGSTDQFRIIQSTDSASVLLPFTKGGYEDVEDEEEEISDRIFLDRSSPNFGFTSLDSPRINVRMKFSHEIEGFEDVQTGQIDLSIRNKVNNNETVKIILTSLG